MRKEIIKIIVEKNRNDIIPYKLNPFNLKYYDEIGSDRDNVIERWEHDKLKISDSYCRIVFRSKKDILDLLEKYFREDITEKEIKFLIGIYTHRLNLLNTEDISLLSGSEINSLLNNEYIEYDIFTIRRLIWVYDTNDIRDVKEFVNCLRVFKMIKYLPYDSDIEMVLSKEPDKLNEDDLDKILQNIPSSILNDDYFRRIWIKCANKNLL